MKVLKIDFRDVNDDFILYPLGDLHIGSKFTNYKLIHKVVDKIKNEKAYVLGMGDYLQFETKTSVGDKFECNLTNEEQIKYFTDLMQGINLIGLLSGNHDGGRSSKTSNVNVVKTMADALNVPFLGEFIVLVISLKYYSVVISAWHGSGSAGTDYGVYKKMKTIAERKFRNADIYLQGHFHRLMRFPDVVYFDLNRHKNSVVLKKQYYLDTGSFQGYSPYADRLNLQPVELGCWKLVFKNDKKKKIIFEKIVDF